MTRGVFKVPELPGLPGPGLPQFPARMDHLLPVLLYSQAPAHMLSFKKHNEVWLGRNVGFTSAQAIPNYFSRE